MNDQVFTQEAIQALRLFFARFQKMKQNTLYLTGHAYGGVYITHLAKEMLDENEDPFSIFNDKWNLKGIMVGNPCTKPDECYASGTTKYSSYHYEFLYKRGFFAAKYYNDYQTQCTFNYDSYECYVERQQLDKQFNATNTSILNIYEKCYRGENNSNSDLSYVNSGCEDEAGLINYLNENLTKYNWNIRVEDWDRQWTPCNGTIHEAYVSGNNSYYLYPGLIKSGIKIWVYSGDVDANVPITGTKKWINQLRGELQMPVNKNWREWWVPGKHKGEDQVGGFVWELEGLTFASIKGSGLRAGIDQPEAMEEVLNGFITGK